MKGLAVRIKLIFAIIFAAVVAFMVIYSVLSVPALTTFERASAVQLTEQTEQPSSTSMTSSAHTRVTMLRGFAYTLGRRCRAWRRRSQSRP